MDLNSPPSHFDHHHPFVPNRSSSSSSSLSCHFFFDSTRDHAGLIYDHHQLRLYEPNHVPDDQGYGYNHSGSSYEMKNKVESGLNFTLWKKKEEEDDDDIRRNPMTKWMSSKMRVMQKMKTADHDHHRVASSSNDGDQKLQPSSSTDLSSNSSSYNNSPIRVCSDCNTTKTPLWRSGPKGPKSLCNACGIRQRKARRAMAAAAVAAAAANDASANTASDQPAVTTATKIKLQQKGKNGKNGHASQLKKRCKTAVAATGTSGAASNEKKRLGFEDFLINLSKNLAFHRVFPDDERDAAILLMALSSGLVNG